MYCGILRIITSIPLYIWFEAVAIRRFSKKFHNTSYISNAKNCFYKYINVICDLLHDKDVIKKDESQIMRKLDKAEEVENPEDDL